MPEPENPEVTQDPGKGTYPSNPETPPEKPKEGDTPKTPSVQDVIPQSYRDREYLKGIDSFDKLFEQHDNLQKKLGQRPAGIPQDTASDEEWSKFFEAMRPESPDKYEFDTEGLPEAITKNRDEDFEKGVKGLFHEAGLSKKQAQILQKGYDKLLSERFGELENAQKKSDEEFDRLAEKHFGDKKDEVFDNSRTLLKENLPEDMQEYVKDLDNNSLTVIAAILNNFKAKYIDEGGRPSTEPGGDPGNEGDLRAKARELMATEAFRNKSHKDHEAVRQQVDEIYQRFNKK